MTITVNKQELIEALKNTEARSTWRKAIREDAVELVEDSFEQVDEIEVGEERGALEKLLLNGADNWSKYSYGCCARVCNEEIAAHYCTPSEYKRSRGGEWNPNRRENWLDLQARALSQASLLISRTVKKLAANATI